MSNSRGKPSQKYDDHSPHPSGPTPHHADPLPHPAKPSPHPSGPSPHPSGPTPRRENPPPHHADPLPHPAKPSPHPSGPSPHPTGTSPRPVNPSVNQQQQQVKPKQKVVVIKRYFVILESLFLFVGMVTYMADLITDIVVGFQYILLHDYFWSGLTFAFVIIPSITIQYFSFRWFVIDSQHSLKPKHVSFLKRIWDWFVWLIVHILQLGALKRYWRTIKYCWRSHEHPDYYDLSIYEYRDITMLRLLEAFMEAAPQLVLQVYIMTQQSDIYWLTVSSAIISLASLSWGLEAYHKALRESCSNKNNLGYVGLTFRIIWRTFTITARVISLALFASYYKWLIFPLIGIHWVGMTLWLVYQDTDFCTTRLEEVLFDAVIGIIHIFCFFNMKEGRTRYRALFFYTIIFVENTIMFALWYHHDGQQRGYGLPALVFVWGGFFLGLVVMLFYYRCLHPNGNIRLWGGGPPIKPNWKPVLQVDGSAVYDNPGRDEVDGPIPWSDIIIPAATRGCHGNLFTNRGRRYCYWRTEDGTCPCEEPLPNGDLRTTTVQPGVTVADPTMIRIIDQENGRCDCNGETVNCCDKNGKPRIETLL
ncbi:XK-related protein 4-like [Asterias rubens]|uniref:XK-related protein 4-like n=1 Tax=Asterias rubens TaxID=7604 RepID=UPI001454EFEC|nr:XK-related protein 4-like [Asterias rubens]XP_033645385.1 XK-related protein 4-like [Asterias rubens]XP_033645386.1 XK-related protein 4-like [Asterias rubens]